jgi:hypothetical protein
LRRKRRIVLEIIPLLLLALVATAALWTRPKTYPARNDGT